MKAELEENRTKRRKKTRVEKAPAKDGKSPITLMPTST